MGANNNDFNGGAGNSGRNTTAGAGSPARTGVFINQLEQTPQQLEELRTSNPDLHAQALRASANPAPGALNVYQTKYPNRKGEISLIQPKVRFGTDYEREETPLNDSEVEHNKYASAALAEKEHLDKVTSRTADSDALKARLEAQSRVDQNTTRRTRGGQTADEQIQALLEKTKGQATPVDPNRGRGGMGENREETLPGKRLGQVAYRHAGALSDIANTFTAHEHPVLQAIGHVMNTHLHGDESGETYTPGAFDHIKFGDSLNKGVNPEDGASLTDPKTGKVLKQSSLAKESYHKAAGKVFAAYGLAQLGLNLASEDASIKQPNVALPNIDELRQGASTAVRFQPANPFPEANFGGKLLGINSDEMLTAAANAGKSRGTTKSQEETRAVRKTGVARTGAKRFRKIDRTKTVDDGQGTTTTTDRAEESGAAARDLVMKKADRRKVATDRFRSQANDLTPELMTKRNDNKSPRPETEAKK
jgi:hypothetical protein